MDLTLAPMLHIVLMDLTIAPMLYIVLMDLTLPLPTPMLSGNHIWVTLKLGTRKWGGKWEIKERRRHITFHSTNCRHFCLTVGSKGVPVQMHYTTVQLYVQASSMYFTFGSLLAFLKFVGCKLFILCFNFLLGVILQFHALLCIHAYLSQARCEGLVPRLAWIPQFMH